MSHRVITKNEEVFFDVKEIHKRKKRNLPRQRGSIPAVQSNNLNFQQNEKRFQASKNSLIHASGRKEKEEAVKTSCTINTESECKRTSLAAMPIAPCSQIKEIKNTAFHGIY